MSYFNPLQLSWKILDRTSDDDIVGYLRSIGRIPEDCSLPLNQRPVQFRVGVDALNVVSLGKIVHEMQLITSRWPMVLFQVDCWGEEYGNILRIYFLGDSYQTRKPTITFEPETLVSDAILRGKWTR